MSHSVQDAIETRLGELEAANAALQARVRELEDAREITELFFDWHYGCTGGFRGKQAGRFESLEILAEDATIELHGYHGAGQGPKGREECREFWAYWYGDDGPLPYVFQTNVGDKVVVKGDTAIHKTNMLGMFYLRDEGASVRLSQRTNEWVRTPQGWRIRKTTIDGGVWVAVDKLRGDLNPLPPPEPRAPWTHKA